MHVDTFEEVLYPETLATDMLDLAAVILVNGPVSYTHLWRENLFETLPEDRKTAEVCRFAIKKSAFNIEFVPEAMKICY